MTRVLIIGATSAIAQEVARRHADRGAQLFLIARNADKLERLVAGLGDAVVGSMVADLDETEHAEARIDEAIERLGAVDVALIAHGDLGDQLESEAQWSVARSTLTTNFLSVVALLIPLANAMERRGEGRIAVMASVAGERGRPRNYTYGAAKGALTIYLQGLRSRLVPSGVHVHTLKLGPVDTPMTRTHRKTALFAKPDAVADDIMRALEGPGGEHFVPWFWAPIMSVVRGLPERVFQRVGALSGR